MSFENPWVHGLIVGLIIANVSLGVTGYSIWFERKFAGRMQNRPGPNVVGPWGLLQPLADVLKLMQKEDIVPASADKTLYNLAPPLTVFTVLSTLAVIPVAPGWIVADLHIGILFALAAPSESSRYGWPVGRATTSTRSSAGCVLLHRVCRTRFHCF
jgi:NADH-quinone oxidoreductase subunit H